MSGSLTSQKQNCFSQRAAASGEKEGMIPQNKKAKSAQKLFQQYLVKRKEWFLKNKKQQKNTHNKIMIVCMQQYLVKRKEMDHS